MNILSVGGRYKPTNGGNAKRISTMCEAFCKLGHNVTVLTCDAYGTAEKDEYVSGVRVLRYENYRELVKNIENVSKQAEADAILVHEETYLRMLRFANIDVPVFFECHAIEPKPNKAKEMMLNVFRRLYFREDFIKNVFVLSKNAKSQFSGKFSYPKKRIIYTPNGIDKSDNFIGCDNFAQNSDFVYGYSGTLYEFQGIKVLLKYAKDILEIAQDVKIMIVGGGPLEEEVRQFVAENRCDDRIVVTGSVSQAEFDRLTSKFDVLMMPRPSTASTESAVPLKVFDAARHKKPVVMSNVSGLTEAFSEKAALIYDHSNPSEFVECCRKIYRNKELATKLIQGETDALLNWPTVEDVARKQIDAMKCNN